MTKQIKTARVSNYDLREIFKLCDDIEERIEDEIIDGVEILPMVSCYILR